MRPRQRHKLTALQMRECRLNSASREPGRVGDLLMRLPRGPVDSQGGLAIQVQIHDERGRPTIVADNIWHQRIQNIRINRELLHERHYINNWYSE